MAKSKKPQQLTIPAMITESESPTTDGTISIDLDDQDCNGGRAISYAVFQQLVANYNQQEGLPKDTKVAYIVDKQLLHILLSSRQCTGLMLCKCMRTKPDGSFIESMALLAVDSNGDPCGLQKTGTGKDVTFKLADDGSQPPAGEWIQGVTVRDELDRGILRPSLIKDRPSDFEFAGLINLLGAKGIDQGLL